MPLPELIIATSNENKLNEIRSILELPGTTMLSLRDFEKMPDAPETGNNFAEIAMQKAQYYFDHFHKPVIAEDSGLVIPSLGGFPGIYSARVGPDDETRIRIVLEKLTGGLDRSAYYVCDMVFLSEQSLRTEEDRCDGAILASPRGRLGFGYDPIFVPEGSHQTFAEMSADEKNRYSHRGKAARKILNYLRNAWS
jgi:XTP/dITP diphosphohydrolase